AFEEFPNTAAERDVVLGRGDEVLNGMFERMGDLGEPRDGYVAASGLDLGEKSGREFGAAGELFDAGARGGAQNADTQSQGFQEAVFFVQIPPPSTCI